MYLIINTLDMKHIYNISSDGNLIFYSDADFLVFESIICVYARKYGIRISALCIMRNHYHLFAVSGDDDALKKYISVVQSVFVKEYNRKHSFHIRFKNPFGWDEKRTSKEIRSCYVYIANNPVEKNDVRAPYAYKWNFLPFQDSTAVICQAGMSVSFRCACAALRYMRASDHYVSYSLLQSVYELLSSSGEYQKYLDYARSLYNMVDSEAALAYYRGAEHFAEACAAFAGSEYNVGEEYSHEDYGHYASLQSRLERMSLIDPFGRLSSGSRSRISVQTIIVDMLVHGAITEREVHRFFHVNSVVL